jgi:tetratricopeptide (TPR) repeat protein
LIAAFISLLALLGQLTLADTAAPAAGDAEALFREGLKAYDAKEYARAIESFEAAHKLSPLPEILFDIAMARRALGDCRGAADGFDAFIAAAPADDPLLARARARRAELGSCASAAADGSGSSQVAAADKPPPVPSLAAPTPRATLASTAPILIATAPEPASRGQERPWLRGTCFASAGGTAALGVGALVFGLQARSAQQEAEAVDIWDDAALRADERGRTYARVASTLAISAGVTTAIAAASCIAMSRFRTDR